jgi:hypothetical protein
MTIKRKIIFLIGLIIFTHLVLYKYFVYVSNKKNELSIQLNNYKKNKKNIKIVFFGDSHVARSIDVNQIDNSYSLAYFGENNMMNYYKLKYCINNQLMKPLYAVFPCDIVTYSKGYNNYRTNKYFYYSLIPINEIQHINENKLNTIYDYLKIKIVPYTEWRYAFNKMNTNRLKKSNEEFSKKSVEEQEKDATQFIYNKLLEGGNKKKLFDERALNYLQKTILLCQENKIKLIFVKFPLTKNIFDVIKFKVDSSFIRCRPAEKIINQYSIPILNFEYLYQNNPELFFDSHHLNIIGKNKFTSILKQKLDSLYKVY